MLVDDLQKDRSGGARCDTAKFPSTCPSYADFDLADAGVLFVGGDAGRDDPGDLELAGALDLQVGVEGHAELVLGVFGEDALEGLLEQRGVEGVAHHHMTPEI